MYQVCLHLKRLANYTLYQLHIKVKIGKFSQ